MKNNPKKVPKNFRMNAELVDELKKRSEVSGINETRIVEDALTFHFAQNMKDQLAKVAASFTKGVKRPFSQPSARSGCTVGVYATV